MRQRIATGEAVKSAAVLENSQSSCGQKLKNVCEIAAAAGAIRIVRISKARYLAGLGP
jgi:hypothetical protein